MKKSVPYIVLAVMVLLLVMYLITSYRKSGPVFDERISLRIKDKIPYGMYAAYQLLPHLFPNAQVIYEKKSPVEWDSVSGSAANQAVFLVTKEFDAEEYELNELAAFAREGNYVFIIARYLSYDASEFFNCSDNGNYFDFEAIDSLRVNLQRPTFPSSKAYLYPGKKYESYFSSIDTARALVLGRGSDGAPNFIRMNAGNGAVFIHTAPLAFSNYFILHKNNIDYYRNALSVIPSSVTKLVWNDYYLTKPRVKTEKDPSWFRVLLKYPAFRWGLFTAIGTLLLFVLLEMRRKQRMIPSWGRPKNDSLDFVKTIGRLYFDKGDHKNLAKKMGAYFLEHIRSHYKLATHSIDEAFIEAVHGKTGYPHGDIKRLVHFIQFVDTAPAISEAQLSDFHKQLELFYQNT